MTHRFAAVLLLALVAAGPATRPAHTPFVAVLLRDFPTWDRNGDGVLTPDEIDRVVRDPTVTGEDAAAAAAVKLLSQNKKLTVPVPPLTVAYFSAYDRQAMALRGRGLPPAATQPAAAEAATVDTVSTPAAPAPATTRPAARSARLPLDWDLYFVASKARIARGGPDRFPGRFVLDHTRQGPLGDCYFVAAVGALVNHDPAQVSSLLTVTPDHKYRVAFPNVPAVTIGGLSDGELAISSTTAGDGAWLAVLEQGFGRGRAHAKLGNAGDDVEGTDQIRNGGTISAAITLVTGHPTRRVQFARTVERRKELAPKVLPLIRTELTAALADGRLVLASVHPPETAPTTQQVTTRPALAGTLPTIPPNITTKHAYAVLAYDAKADTLTLWNPHGQLFHPAGPDGLANGYTTEHGRFTVPLTEAYQFVTGLAIERSPAATRPAR